jgi:membrane-associated phospholipid phosphatase
MRPMYLTLALTLATLALAPCVHAAGGPLGIDHKLHYDNHGIWKRSTQKDLQYAMIATILGGSFALGDNNKLGDTFWRSMDAVAFSAAGSAALKMTFQRKRPSQTDNPNEFFKGIKYQSFPSGEVTAISAAVTPFMVRYGHDHPAVYALALLPTYDAIARMKTHGHWQTDVLAGAALGTGFGIWASRRKSPLILSWLPGGFKVGFIHHFK